MLPAANFGNKWTCGRVLNSTQTPGGHSRFLNSQREMKNWYLGRERLRKTARRQWEGAARMGRYRANVANLSAHTAGGGKMEKSTPRRQPISASRIPSHIWNEAEDCFARQRQKEFYHYCKDYLCCLFLFWFTLFGNLELLNCREIGMPINQETGAGGTFAGWLIRKQIFESSLRVSGNLWETLSAAASAAAGAFPAFSALHYRVTHLIVDYILLTRS